MMQFHCLLQIPPHFSLFHSGSVSATTTPLFLILLFLLHPNPLTNFLPGFLRREFRSRHRQASFQIEVSEAEKM